MTQIPQMLRRIQKQLYIPSVSLLNKWMVIGTFGATNDDFAREWATDFPSVEQDLEKGEGDAF